MAVSGAEAYCFEFLAVSAVSLVDLGHGLCGWVVSDIWCSGHHGRWLHGRRGGEDGLCGGSGRVAIRLILHGMADGNVVPRLRLSGDDVLKGHLRQAAGDVVDQVLLDQRRAGRALVGHRRCQAVDGVLQLLHGQAGPRLGDPARPTAVLALLARGGVVRRCATGVRHGPERT